MAEAKDRKKKKKRRRIWLRCSEVETVVVDLTKLQSEFSFSVVHYVNLECKVSRPSPPRATSGNDPRVELESKNRFLFHVFFLHFYVVTG